MSRAGYADDCEDPLRDGRWRAAVNSAMRGKRGQAFLREALTTLDAMPDKRLVAGHLQFDGWQGPWDGEEVIVGGDELTDWRGVPMPMGSVCLLGAVGRARGTDMTGLDPHDMDTVAPTFGIADAMAREIVYWNDECGHGETPEQRWARMRKWIETMIAKE